jgi:hypothetical protein
VGRWAAHFPRYLVFSPTSIFVINSAAAIDNERNRAERAMTTRMNELPGTLTPARRIALLREIREGGHLLRDGPSAEAHEGWPGKLAEWRELDRLQDIRLRVVQTLAGNGGQQLVAVAVLTLAGLRRLQWATEAGASSRKEGTV